jgi:steroid 5-alpha reductase family enzyme
MTWNILLLLGAATVTALMFVLWLAHLPLRNASIVDIGWALGLAILGVGYALFAGTFTLRAALIATMSGVWGLRLALHLARRILGHPEEGRYVELRNQWRTHLGLKFLLFFEMQALSCVVLSIPFLAAAVNPSPQLTWLEIAAAALWLIAICGEAIADTQLASFKRDPYTKGRVCQVGLWH